MHLRVKARHGGRVQDLSGNPLMPERHRPHPGGVSDPGQELDLRLVHHFTVVAAHRHFGRAAADLHVAQPALSRQIQRLEKQLGARLLDRTPQGARLTPAGQEFLPWAEALLRAARQASLAVREKAGAARLTVGYVEDLVITDAVRELRRRYPEAEIVTRYLDCHDVVALTEHRIDALIARSPLPLAEDEVTTVPLYEEPRMLVVPREHPLAGRASVSAEELAGQEALPCAFETEDWTSYRILRSGVPPLESAFESPVETYEDKLELVASGRAIGVLPVGDRRSSLRPDLVSVPLEGAPPSQVVLASRKDDANPMVDALRLAAETALTAPAS